MVANLRLQSHLQGWMLETIEVRFAAYRVAKPSPRLDVGDLVVDVAARDTKAVAKPSPRLDVGDILRGALQGQRTMRIGRGSTAFVAKPSPGHGAGDRPLLLQSHLQGLVLEIHTRRAAGSDPPDTAKPFPRPGIGDRHYTTLRTKAISKA